MRIIPAIDILNGKCVRLQKGRFTTAKIYHEQPLEVAKQIADSGLRYLHLVDLDGARQGKVVNYKVLEQISHATDLQIDFGGGLYNDKALHIAFESGAAQVVVGSVAVSRPDIFARWLAQYGPQRVILAADSRNRQVRSAGWLADTDLDVVDFIAGYEQQGVRYVLSTDISRDGMLAGPALLLYKDILSTCKVNLIASGGVSSIADLQALKQSGCEAAIIGKALYEGRFTLAELVNLC